MPAFQKAIVSVPGRVRTARTPYGAKLVIHVTAAETGSGCRSAGQRLAKTKLLYPVARTCRPEAVGGSRRLGMAFSFFASFHSAAITIYKVVVFAELLMVKNRFHQPKLSPSAYCRLD
ncbi:hypothetical protein QA644_34445 (plasmid) [Rhizobium sp. CC1099]|uniref:hypothetical protein n=1 Tax=Rhizobium sp. CC1099 TaxID=3039160 RepID=UPI0024B1D69D|nr:hypothetical protein [Rhizobium sp. CC1099]WFU92003.1 hypothetical protein QA644_34445 [Rhizobium sp. CC1099]